MTNPPRGWLAENVLPLAQTVLLLGAIGAWAVSKGDLTDQNKTQIAQLKDDLMGQIKDLKSTVQTGQQSLQSQIQDLPTNHAELTEHAREIDGLQHNLDALSDRVGATEGNVIRLRSDLDNAVRASSVPLMPGRSR